MNSESVTNALTRSAIAMCILGMLFYCYEYFLRVAPSVMSAELKLTFGLGEAAFGHLVAFYYYAYTPMQIPVGMMMDRFGPRKLLTLACFLSAFGIFLFAFTEEIVFAQFGRFLVGFGAAFAYVGFLKICNLWLPKKYFALMAGICSTMGMFGAIGGQVSMSYLVASLGWQSTLYCSVVMGIILTLLLWAVLRDHGEGLQVQTEHLLDVFQHKFSSLKEMLLSSQMWINGIIGCLTFLPISGFAEVWAVSFLEVVGISKNLAAIGSAMLFLGFAVGGPFWGWVSELIQSRRIPMMIGSFVSAGIMMIVIFVPTNSLTLMYLLLFFTTFFASAEVIIFAVSNDLSHASVSGTGVAFTNMICMLGGASLPWIIGKLLDNAKAIQVVEGLPVLTSQDYASALVILPLSLVVAGILSIILKETHPKQKGWIL